MKKVIILCALALALFQSAFSKPIPREEILYPEVGKPCPDFVLRNIEYFDKKSATLRDFKGKWLIIDFWTQYCGACVASFPRTNELQRQFKDKVQIVMVAYTGTWKGVTEVGDKVVRSMYAKYRAKEDLTMPCAFDSALFDRFDIAGCPHVIVIDDKGIVRAVTSSLTAENMTDFLNGKNPEIRKAYYRAHDERMDAVKFDRNAPLLTNGNGGNDTSFLYRSLLTRWKITDPAISANTIEDYKAHGRFQVLGVQMADLFAYAYIGEIPFDFFEEGSYARHPFWLMDSSIFKPDWNTGKNLYSYSLNIPAERATRGKMMQIMQNDLENYFGLTAWIVTRNVPCWNLIATDQAKAALRTKGGKMDITIVEPHTHFIAKNTPIKYILGSIGAEHQSDIFIDATGIDGNVDLELDCIIQNMGDLTKTLQAQGLDLVPGETQRKVLVIRRARPETEL